MNEANHKQLHIVSFHLYEVFRTGKPTDGNQAGCCLRLDGKENGARGYAVSF